MFVSVGLPLLIVKDTFKSLNTMSVEELETFIPFMVKCSMRCAAATHGNKIPEWWTSNIKYQFPLQKSGSLSQLGYHRHLKNLVYNCYCYHKAQYLLSISTKLALNICSIIVRNNSDNTTSVFFLDHEKHVVTFSNENRFYDAHPKTPQKGSKKRLLPQIFKTSSVLDIYLCDNCDAEFSSHAEMQKHEQECYAIVIDDSDDNNNGKDEEEEEEEEKNLKKYKSDTSGTCYSDEHEDPNSSSSEEIEVIKHIRPGENDTPLKDKFFNYLCLYQNENENLSILKKHCFGWTAQRRNRKKEKFLIKSGNIEFSTNFGRKILENYRKYEGSHEKERNAFWYEAFCRTSPERNRKCHPEAKISFRRRGQAHWNHEYSFGRSQRLKRYEFLKTGLNERSRKLLKQCKRLKIVLTRIKVPS